MHYWGSSKKYQQCMAEAEKRKISFQESKDDESYQVPK